LYNNLY